MGNSSTETSDSDWKGLCKIGGAAALIIVVCSLITMIVVLTLGAEPRTASEYFTVLNNNRVVGLFRLYFSDVISIVCYYPLFFGLYAALRRTDAAYAALATTLAFVGSTLWFAAHPAFSMLALSDRHAAASTDALRSQLLAAGEAIHALDQYRSTGGIIGAILSLGAAVLISSVMLRSNIFSKVTAYMGILANGLDLTRLIIGIFVPGRADFLMAIAGPLYLVWFILLGRRLFQLGHLERKTLPQES